MLCLGDWQILKKKALIFFCIKTHFTLSFEGYLSLHFPSKSSHMDILHFFSEKFPHHLHTLTLREKGLNLWIKLWTFCWVVLVLSRILSYFWIENRSWLLLFLLLILLNLSRGGFLSLYLAKFQFVYKFRYTSHICILFWLTIKCWLFSKIIWLCLFEFTAYFALNVNRMFSFDMVTTWSLL